jgi:uncharacterized protein with NRDE domain
MCLIVVAWRQHPRWSLVLAANRDEFYARPSTALAPWPDRADIFAGRDLEAGGTWMGVQTSGRFAAVTNVRDPRDLAPRPASRGALVADFLRGDEAPEVFARRASAERERYKGFNLLLGDARALWYVGSRHPEPIALTPGIHGLSNATLDTPWPKVEHGKAVMRDALARPEHLEAIVLEGMADHRQAADAALPDTGVGLVWERALSPAFIATENYGTRATTLLSVAEGEWRIRECGFGPLGQRIGDVEFARP